MKLWLYSSGDLESNRTPDQMLIQQLDKKKPKICFVPSCHEDFEYYYEEFADRFNSHADCKLSVLHLDLKLKEKHIRQALKSDLIYLSGGNTFYFLKHIRASGVEPSLWTYLQSGGVLAGHSAGAIVMTPNINTASYPDDDRDDNEVGLVNLRAMRLCNFEIFPHYMVRSRSQNEALRRASTDIHHVIYALPDGTAVAVDGNAITIHGPVWCFARGTRLTIST